MNTEEFYKQWLHFFKCVNVGASALDADAIKFANEFGRNIDTLFSEEEVKTIVKKAISNYGFDDKVDDALKIIDEMKVIKKL